MATSLKIVTRDTDLVGRLGGEEFGVCLPNTGIKQALLVCEKIRSGIEKLQIIACNNEIRVTMSMGIATACQEEEFWEELLVNNADKQLYRSKNGGRNTISYAEIDL